MPESPKDSKQELPKNSLVPGMSLAESAKDIGMSKKKETMSKEEEGKYRETLRDLLKLFPVEWYQRSDETYADSGPIEETVSKFDKVSREKFAAIAEKHLETKWSPVSWNQMLDVLRQLYLLSLFDAQAGKRHRALAAQVTTAAIEFLKRKDFSSPQDATRDTHEKLLRIYYLQSLQYSTEGQRMCEEVIGTLQENMVRKAKGKIPTILAREEHQYITEEPADASEIKKLLVGAHPEVRRNLHRENGIYVYTHLQNGRESKWEIACIAYHFYVLRNTTNPDAKISLQSRDFINAWEKNDLGKYIQEAMHNFAMEERGQEFLNAFDLPKEGAITHIRLFPKQYDYTIASSLRDSAFLSAALRERYGEKMMTLPVVFTLSPKRALIDEVRKAHQDGKGSKDFVIDIFSHGSKDHLKFVEPLTAADLVDVIRQFPDCHFTFGTVACFGGGLRNGFLEEFKKDPKLAKRMQIFIQTKPTLEGSVTISEKDRAAENKEKRLLHSTLYYSYFIRALYAGKTYGQAASEADKMVKRNTYLDPEAIIDGHLITMSFTSLKQEEAVG